MRVDTMFTTPGPRTAADYMQWWDYEAMNARGITCVLRYFKRTGNNDKELRDAQALHDHNIGIILIAEWDQYTSLKGPGQGYADGQTARAYARDHHGYPRGLPIICSIDTAVTPGNAQAVTGYVRAFHDALGGEYALGVYGGSVIIKAFQDISECNHIANARSWSTNPPWPGVGLPIHFVQYVQHDPTRPYDENDIVKPCRMWLPHYVPDPVVVVPDPPIIITPPIHQENAMTLTTIETFGRPERPYNSTDPAGPNPLNPYEVRRIASGHPDATVANIHISVIGRSVPGYLLFWDGSAPVPVAATVNYGGAGTVSDCSATVPLVDGQFVVVANTKCDLVIDLQGVDVPS